MKEPLRHGAARSLIRWIVAGGGGVMYAEPHAVDMLAKRNLTRADCENVLRSGWVSEPEWENGAWRYQVSTRKITVVAQLMSEERLLVVTAWRNE